MCWVFLYETFFFNKIWLGVVLVFGRCSCLIVIMHEAEYCPVFLSVSACPLLNKNNRLAKDRPVPSFCSWLRQNGLCLLSLLLFNQDKLLLLCRCLHCPLVMQPRSSVRPFSLLKDETRLSSYCSIRPAFFYSFRPAQRNAFVRLYHK